MTDELQTSVEAEESTGIIIDSGEDETTETAESGADLAPVTEENQDKNDDGVQKAINKQHAKYREEERKRIEVEKKLAAADEKLKAFEDEKSEVTIPPIPDSFDEDFEEKIKIRDEAIMRQAQQEAQQQRVIEQQDATKEAAQTVAQERMSDLVTGYDKRIATLGLSSEEIRKAGDTVVSYGIDGGVAEFILGDKDGPLITKYLAENPLELDELRNLPPIQAAMRIDSVIRPVASTLKPQASTAPDPAETLSGRGAGEKVHPLIAGVKFE